MIKTKSLGTRLKNLRDEKRLSQQQVADNLSVSLTSYNKWESDIAKPTTENLLKIADFYNTDLYTLLDSSQSKIICKKCSISNIGNPENATFYNTPPEFMEAFLNSNSQLLTLVENQNKIMATFSKKEL